MSILDTHISEAELQEKILDYAELRGWLIHHDRPARTSNGEWRTAVQGHKGFPDLVLGRRGRIVIAELKAEKANPSPAQKKWLDALAPPGAIPDAEVFVWRPSDWSHIERVLA